jgi:hypothetical protein
MDYIQLASWISSNRTESPPAETMLKLRIFTPPSDENYLSPMIVSSIETTVIAWRGSTDVHDPWSIIPSTSTVYPGYTSNVWDPSANFAWSFNAFDVVF